MVRITSALLAAVALTGCVGADGPAGSIEAAPAPQTTASQPASQPEISSIRLQRSPCFGACPVYEIELSSSGQVKYVGDRFVEQTGFHTSSIQRSDFQAVVEEVKAIHFFSLKDQYRFEPDGCTSWMTDQPTATFIVTADGKDKIVSYYYGCQGLPIGPQLEALADAIDEVSGSKRWVGREGAP